MSAIVDTLTATLLAAPDSWQCRLALIEALIAEEQVDEAYAVLSNVTELPEDAESCLMAARAYGLLEPASGIEILEGIIAADPTNAPAYLEKARLLLAENDLESARLQYSAATTFDPTINEPELAAALGLVVEETEVATAVPAIAVPSPTPAPLKPEPDASTVYYPAPGEFPTITLREALAVTNIAPLVHPDSIPAHPRLAYQEEIHHPETVHTDTEAYRASLHNVEVQTAYYEQPVVYDYQQPDDTVFEPTITQDQIYVSALITENGEKVANLQESIRRNKAEKEAEIQKRERVAKIQSVVVALVSLVGICLLMIMAVTSVPRPSPPQIVASSVVTPEDSLEEATIKQTKITPTPTQSASAMSMDVMTVASASSVSMMSFDSPTMDLGSASMGMDFGSSMSFGDEAGGGSVMFFGGKSSGKRFLFVLDASASMKPEQIKLRDDELEKTLKTLKNVEFQVLLFAGGAYFADKGWGEKPKSKKGKYGPEHFESPKGSYSFSSTSLFDFTLLDEKDFKTPKWKKSTSSEVRQTVKFVKDSTKFTGTDWDNALRMGHMMDPPPDVIFFMSDGLDNKLNIKEILRNNKKYGRPKINCVAMQTAKGADKFGDIAKGSRGSYTIVDKDGEPIDGFEYMKDPGSFAGRLKF
ncbi:MAG: hypothetical protein P1U89_13160 [Verrucomicrobiales bacterium]|nr:hypothetical protein [Verrucomicrobiales bacterium]